MKRKEKLCLHVQRTCTVFYEIMADVVQIKGLFVMAAAK